MLSMRIVHVIFKAHRKMNAAEDYLERQQIRVKERKDYISEEVAFGNCASEKYVSVRI